MRSRYESRGIGAQVFAPTPQPTCPPGQHWVDTGPTTTLKGLGACVPNTVVRVPLTLRPVPAAAPAPAPPVAPAVPVTFQPSGGDAAAAPTSVPSQAMTCPAPWPLWWLLVAAAAGAGLGYYVKKDQRKVKKNAGRIANMAASRVVNAGVARLLG